MKKGIKSSLTVALMVLMGVFICAAKAPELTPTPIEPPEEDDFQYVVPAKPTVKRSIFPKVKLSWESVDGATEYTVYRSRRLDGGYKPIATVNKTHYSDRNIRRRRTYYYGIVAGKETPEGAITSELGMKRSVYVWPEHPKTVIIGECFAVSLELAKDRFPSYYRFIAKGGMTTYSILYNNEFTVDGRSVTALEKASLYHPDRLVFLVGANGAGSVNPADAGRNFVKMFRLMKRINPKIQFVILAVSPWKRDSTYGRKMPSHEKRHQINEAYKAVADKHKNIYYCDLTERLEDSNGDLSGQFNTGDGLHWSGYAREYMTEALQKWLKKNLGTA